MKPFILFFLLMQFCIFSTYELSAQRKYKHYKWVKREVQKTPGKVAEVTDQVPLDEGINNHNYTAEVGINHESETKETPVLRSQGAEKKKEKRLEKTASVKPVWTNTVSEENVLAFAGQSVPVAPVIRKAFSNASAKPMLVRWLRIMIILYAVGLIFLILAIVFDVTRIGVAALISYLIFAMLWIAATIVLILGLTGVMH